MLNTAVWQIFSGFGICNLLEVYLICGKGGIRLGGWGNCVNVWEASKAQGWAAWYATSNPAYSQSESVRKVLGPVVRAIPNPRRYLPYTTSIQSVLVEGSSPASRYLIADTNQITFEVNLKGRSNCFCPQLCKLKGNSKPKIRFGGLKLWVYWLKNLIEGDLFYLSFFFYCKISDISTTHYCTLQHIWSWNFASPESEIRKKKLLKAVLFTFFYLKNKLSWEATILSPLWKQY